MKKIIFILFIVFGFVSCSNDVSDLKDNSLQGVSSSYDNSAEVQRVRSEIFSLNDATWQTTQPQTRGFWKGIKKFFRIVKADAVGAIFGMKLGVVGAAAGAATCSALAAIYDNNDNSSSSNTSGSDDFPYDSLHQGNTHFNPDSISFSNVVPSNPDGRPLHLNAA